MEKVTNAPIATSDNLAGAINLIAEQGSYPARVLLISSAEVSGVVFLIRDHVVGAYVAGTGLVGRVALAKLLSAQEPVFKFFEVQESQLPPANRSLSLTVGDLLEIVRPTQAEDTMRGLGSVRSSQADRTGTGMHPVARPPAEPTVSGMPPVVPPQADQTMSGMQSVSARANASVPPVGPTDAAAIRRAEESIANVILEAKRDKFSKLQSHDGIASSGDKPSSQFDPRELDAIGVSSAPTQPQPTSQFNSRELDAIGVPAVPTQPQPTSQSNSRELDAIRVPAAPTQPQPASQFSSRELDAIGAAGAPSQPQPASQFDPRELDAIGGTPSNDRPPSPPRSDSGDPVAADRSSAKQRITPQFDPDELRHIPIPGKQPSTNAVETGRLRQKLASADHTAAIIRVAAAGVFLVVIAAIAFFLSRSGQPQATMAQEVVLSLNKSVTGKAYYSVPHAGPINPPVPRDETKAAAQSADTEDYATKLQKEVDQAMDHKDPGIAIGIYRKGLDEHPKDIALRERAVKFFIHMGKTDLAKQYGQSNVDNAPVSQEKMRLQAVMQKLLHPSPSH